MPHGKAVATMLTGDEREQLKANVRRGDGAGPLAERSRMILLAADGLSNEAIAARLGVRGVTVGRWRRRFSVERIDGLRDERRPGRPRVIDDAKVREVVAALLPLSHAASAAGAATAASRAKIRNIVDVHVMVVPRVGVQTG